MVNAKFQSTPEGDGLNIQEMKTRVANNILDLLIDPTRVPVKDRVYFRDEEMLKNESYEKAKADACAAFKEQKHNSDFYPHKNRSLNREATIMDRKTLIASLDVLSKNFKNASDPIAADLSTMAKALSKMSDDELMPRLASEAPDLETVLAGKKCEKCGEEDCVCATSKEAAETFACPDCGTKVLKQTGYCVKCKKKVKSAEDVAATEVEAGDPGSMTWNPAQRGDWRSSIDPKNYKKKPTQVKEEAYAIFEKKVPEFAEKTKVLQPKTPDEKIEAIGEFLKSTKPTDMKVKKVVEEVAAKCASAEDFWTKEASAVVAKALVSEIMGVVADDDADADDVPAAEPKKEDKKEEPKAEPKKEEPKAEPVVAKKEEVKPVEAKKEEPKAEEVVPPEPGSKEAVVDTAMLASVTFAGIEVPTGIMSMDDVGEMSEQEKANLAKLF